MLLLIKKIIQPLLLKRKADSNKSTFGHALIIAGTKGKMGAAVIAAMACLRSGCGLLTVHVPVQERLVLQTTLPEAMVMFRRKTIKQLDDYSAIGIGPGLGAVVLTKLLLLQIFMEYKMAVVVDADALNVLAAYPKLILKIPKHTILTPHQVEFDRLFGVHKNTAQRLRTAKEKAKALSIIIILKSHKTFITNGKNHYTNTTGNTSLAKASSGDALTGIVTS